MDSFSRNNNSCYLSHLQPTPPTHTQHLGDSREVCRQQHILAVVNIFSLWAEDAIVVVISDNGMSPVIYVCIAGVEWVQ